MWLLANYGECTWYASNVFTASVVLSNCGVRNDVRAAGVPALT